jgi:plastocyanin domain-containing protein
MRLLRRLFKPLVALFGIGAAMAGIWWFALKPERSRKDEGT